MLYSVPHEYIKRKVDVRVTDKTIEVFYNNKRIASHCRLYGHKGQYSTITEHMPPSHQQYLEWNGGPFPQMGRNDRENTYRVTERDSYLQTCGATVLQELHGAFKARR